jgi:hypothetical protein
MERKKKSDNNSTKKKVPDSFVSGMFDSEGKITRNHNFAILSKALIPSETVIFLEGYALRKCGELQATATETATG